MKKIIIISSLLFSTAQNLLPFILTYDPLKIIDKSGILNKRISDILRIRKEIKNFQQGKLIWSGVEFNLEILDQAGNSTGENFNVIMKRPETLFGANYVIISPNHSQISKFTTSQTQKSITSFIQTISSKSLLSRYQNPSNQSFNTTLFVKNPMTQALMPIIISDYAIENYDMRMVHAHVATPAHDQKDFMFAKAHNFAIKLVINCPEGSKTSLPAIDPLSKQLAAAYLGEYSDCIIVDSDFLNGSIHQAHEKAMSYLMEHINAQEYKKNMVYHLGNKYYSLKDFHGLEATLQKENKVLSDNQKDLFKILLIQVRTDFISIVEQFLVNAKATKDLMIPLIEESCNLRQKQDAYLLKWSHMNINESEKIIFQRDIHNFAALNSFCTELIDYLEDFASSCPTALEYLKNLKHT